MREMIRFKLAPAAGAVIEPERPSPANTAVDVVPVPDVISVTADDHARSIPEPLELSSDLPPRKPAKRRAAALKKPRVVELVHADTAPLMLNLDP
jgi:hypothetical protein